MNLLSRSFSVADLFTLEGFLKLLFEEFLHKAISQNAKPTSFLKERSKELFSEA